MKTKKIKEEDILNLSAEFYKPKAGIKVDRDSEKKLFEKLAEVEGFADYLREMLSNDIIRYFKATTPMEQLMARGAYSRTLYLKSLLSLKKKDKEVKFISKRHA